jgi:ankyrin repeat protein
VKIFDNIKFFRPARNLGDREMSIDDKLIDACRRRNLSAVKACVEQGADIHADDDVALRWAADNGHLEIVKYLIEQGANIHAMGDYALRYAAYEGRLEVVKYLIECGANIHVEKDFALRYAVYYDYLHVTNVLRKAAGDAYKCNRCIIKSTCLELCEDFRQY